MHENCKVCKEIEEDYSLKGFWIDIVEFIRWDALLFLVISFIIFIATMGIIGLPYLDNENNMSKWDRLW